MVSGKLKPSNFIGKVEFGTVESVTNRNTGGKTKTFVSKVGPLRYAPRTRSITQTENTFGTDLKDTRIIAVRHNNVIDESMKIRFVKDKKVYDVKYVSSDESNSPIKFDYITILKEPLGVFDG